jgi:hypothetical protein
MPLAIPHPIPRAVYALLVPLLLAAVALELDGQWLAAAAGLLGPDIALAFGAGRDLRPGQLHPRAVPLYNALHRLWGPVLLVAAAAAELVPAWTLVAGLAWLAHVAVDRAVGYGLRTPEGLQR